MSLSRVSLLFAGAQGGHLLLLLAGTLWSVLRPDRRLWPPPGHHPWQFVATWVLFVVATVGWVVLTGSARVGLVGLVAVVWYLLLPRAEEPWLEERHGEAYRRYRERVPRFI